MENLEDVVNACNDFDVWFLLVHHRGEVVKRPVGVEVAGEIEEARVVGVFGEERIVFAGERAPQHVAADVFTPFQLLDERNAVEDLAVHVPRDHKRGIAVVEKLHIVDEVERIVLHDEREVGRRHNEQGERHLVPLCSAFEVGVDFSP